MGFAAGCGDGSAAGGSANADSAARSSASAAAATRRQPRLVLAALQFDLHRVAALAEDGGHALEGLGDALANGTRGAQARGRR